MEERKGEKGRREREEGGREVGKRGNKKGWTEKKGGRRRSQMVHQ